MNADDVKTLVTTIVTDLNTAADYAGIIDPALIPMIKIGEALDKMLPGLAGNITNWIQGNPPTAQEQADLIQKLTVLGDPNLP